MAVIEYITPRFKPYERPPQFGSAALPEVSEIARIQVNESAESQQDKKREPAPVQPDKKKSSSATGLLSAPGAFEVAQLSVFDPLQPPPPPVDDVVESFVDEEAARQYLQHNGLDPHSTKCLEDSRHSALLCDPYTLARVHEAYRVIGRLTSL